MAIYRGPGGAGDATNDATSQAILAAESAINAASSATAAAASASAASTSATNAASSATSASNSATSATSSANSASTSATNAANSATAAQTAQTAAELAETNAETAEINAETAETNANASATLAQDWATKTSGPVAGSEYSSKYNAQLAATSATNAANSATSASTSASSASTYASNASTSASNAASSASSASTSATNAASSASSASTSATSASTSASTATTQASNAATSATAAATSASNAATSATNAANSATSASTSATNAANSASSASTSETNAAASATAAAASYDSFDDRYLGAKSVAPTVDNDGNPLLVGALYFNTVTNFMKVWDGSSWLDAYASLSGALLSANNLSDLNNVATARNNLGLGTAALVADSTLVHTSGDETIAGTKTLSSNPVLSSGTANGVAYLNGSKVLTTGSALTFNGTNVGVGTATNLGNSLLNVSQGVAAHNVSTTLPYFQTYNSNAGTNLKTWRWGGNSSGALTFETVNDAYSSSTERMRIDSSGNITISSQILNSSGKPILAQTGSVIQRATYTADAGSSTTSTTYVNLTAATKTFTPISTSSTIIIEVTFQGLITAGGSGTNSSAQYILYEGATIGSAYNLGVGSASGTNVQTETPCCIRHTLSNTSTSTRSFLLYGKKTGGTSTAYATNQVWTITEVAA